MTSEGGCLRVRFETLGVRILFVGLVLGLVAGIVWFPVWSGGGTSMRILLGYIANEPLAFVLDRLLPAAAVIGVLGACLLEVGRGRVVRESGRRLDRERFALIAAIAAEGAVLGLFVFASSFGMDLLLVDAAIGIAVTVAVGSYLFWTSERMVGASAKPVRLAAFGTACFSAALAFSVSVALEVPAARAWDTVSVLDVMRWLFGEISLGLWIMAYAMIVGRSRITASPIATAT